MYGSRLKVGLIGEGMECLARKQERPTDVLYLKKVAFYLRVFACEDFRSSSDLD